MMTDKETDGAFITCLPRKLGRQPVTIPRKGIGEYREIAIQFVERPVGASMICTVNAHGMTEDTSFVLGVT
jgi:hypothetical protein